MGFLMSPWEDLFHQCDSLLRRWVVESPLTVRTSSLFLHASAGLSSHTREVCCSWGHEGMAFSSISSILLLTECGNVEDSNFMFLFFTLEKIQKTSIDWESLFGLADALGKPSEQCRDDGRWKGWLGDCSHEPSCSSSPAVNTQHTLKQTQRDSRAEPGSVQLCPTGCCNIKQPDCKTCQRPRGLQSAVPED